MKFRSTSLRLSIVSLLLVITAAFAAIGAQASGLANALDSVQEFLGMSAPLQSTQSLQNTHLLQSTSKYANYAPGTLKNVATNSALVEPMQPMFFFASGPVPFTGTTYTQDFQSITATALTPAVVSSTTMLEVSAQSGGGTVDGWYVYNQAGASRWGRDAGGTGTGSFIGMFDSQSTPNRALGSIASSSQVSLFGVVIKNTSGSTINLVNISFDAMMNKNPSSTANSYPASYRVSATAPIVGSSTADGTLNDAAGTWLASSNLGITTPASGTGAPGTQATITPLFRIGGASKTDTLSSLGWGNNQYLYIRWKDTDEGGSDALAGVDNFSIALSGAASSPTLTAAGGATVDSNLNITFTDDATWRAAVTTVKYGATTLSSGTDYDLNAGVLTLKPGGNAALRAPGTQTVTVQAPGYTDATVSQAINPGAIGSYTVTAASPQATGAAFSTTVTAKDQYSNTVTTNNSTVVTMTSGSGNVQFDSNADTTFGDNTKTLTAGTFNISTKSAVAETTTIIATDAGSKTGNASVTFADPSLASDFFRSNVATGNWATPGSWQSSHDNTTWNTATLAPDNNSSGVLIRNGHNITVSTSVTTDDTVVEATGQISVSGTGTLTIANGTAAPDLTVNGIVGNAGTITPTGTISFASGSKYQHNFTTTAGTIPTATWDGNSAVEILGYTSATSGPSGLGQTFGNFTWNCPSQGGNIGLGNPANFAIAGTLTVTSTGGVTNRSFRLTSGTNYTLSVGSLILNGGHLGLSSGSGTGTLTVGGSIAVSNSSELYLSQGGGAAGIVNVGGDLSVNAATITETGSATGGGLIFNKAGSQNLTLTSATLSNDINYQINSGSTVNLTGSLPINASRLLSVDGTFNTGSGSVTGAGQLIVSGTGTLKGNGTIANAVSTAGNVSPGLSPGTLNTGSIDFSTGSALNIEFGSTTDQLNVTGTVGITGTTSLNFSSVAGMALAAGQTYTIINNDGADAITGTFSNVSNGAVISNFLSSGLNATVTYNGSGGNDLVVAISAPTPTITGAATATAFTTTYGTVSAAQNFSVSGSNLTAGITATAPTGFEVSNGGAFGATTTFTQSGGSASGTLSLRLKANAPVAGSYNSQVVALTSAGASQVNITTSVSGNIVSRAAVTVTASSHPVAYGDAVPTVTASYSAFQNGESSAVVSGTTCSTTYSTSSNFGTNPPTSCSGSTAANYSFSFVPGTVTISKFGVNITASSPTVAYGDPVPTINPSFGSFRNGQNSGALSTQPTCVTAYTTTSPAGTAPSTSCSGAVATNYSFTYTPSTVTINRANATLAFGAAPHPKYPSDANFTATATTNSDGPIVYSVQSGNCDLVSGNNFTASSPGSCTVQADVAETTNFNAATTATLDVTVDATTYAITASAGQHGTIDPAGTTQVPYHTSQQYTITPNAGYKIEDVLVDGQSQGANNLQYSFDNVEDAHTISVTFVLNDLSIISDNDIQAGSYHDITVTGCAKAVLQGDVTITGTFTVSGCATFDPNSHTVSGGSGSALILADGGTLYIQSPQGITAAPTAAGPIRTETRSFSSAANYRYNGVVDQVVGDGLPLTVHDLLIASSDGRTITGNPGQIVTGTLLVQLSTYISASDYNNVDIELGTLSLDNDITVSGNWTNTGGTLQANGHKVTFDGDGVIPQTITGDTTFYDFVKSVTGAQTMNFTAGSMTTVTHGLTLGGDASNHRLSLRSTNESSAWKLVAPSTQAVSYVDAKDSNATGTNPVVATHSVNSLNNTNWTFNYTLTYLSGGNGTISGTTPQTVSYGSSGSQVTAIPALGYHFVDWTPGGLATASRTDSNVQADATYTANFAANTYTLTYTAGANGSITGTSPQTVNHGADGTAVTAVPNSGYQFVNWSDASTQNPRTDTNVQGPISVTANFAAESHTVIFDANGGTGSMANQTANAPTALTTNTFVRSGYTFTGWNTAANGSGTPYANNAIYPFTADATLYAVWAASACHVLTADTGAVSHSTYFGAAITVPVSVSTTTTAEGVISADFDMVYDPAVIRAVHVGTSDVVTATRGAAIIHNLSSGNVTVSEVYATPGTVHVSVYDTAGFDTTSGNTLVNISFTVVGHAGTHSALTLPPSGTSPGDTKFGNAAAGFLCADVVPGDVSVAARATTTSVSTSHPNPAGSTYGTSVTFTATISTTGTPAVSGGSVNFYDGGTDCGAGHGTSLGTVALTGNSAALPTSVLGASATDHTIWACYTGDGADFSASSNTVAQHVNPKPVAPAVTADDKIYDGNADAIVHCSIPGKVSGDDVACTAGGPNTFDSKNVGDPKTVTARNITLTGLTAGNYVLTTPTATTTAKITQRDLNVTATADDKTYDGNTTAVVHLTSDKVAADTVTLSNTSADFDTKDVGNGKTVTVLGISIGGADAPNYHLVNTSTTATAKITGRPLTVTATGINKVYDSTIAATVTLSSNKVSGDVVALHYTTATFADKNVDTGKAVSVSGISIDGADSGNYTLSNTTATTSADITPATLTVTAHGVNKTYDGGTAATVTLSDDHLGSDVVTTGYTTATFAQSNAGTGILVNVSGISITGGADANNYTLNGVTTATTSADIDKKSVTPSITVLDRAYNGSDVAAIDTCTVAVKVGLDDVACSAGGPNTFDSRNAGLRTATARGIILTGSTKDNYTLGAISTATTTATITKLDVNVTAVTDTKTYDGTTSSVGTPTVSPSIISPDTGTFTQAFVGKNVGIGKTITPSGTVDDGNGGLNYSLHFISDTTGVISARAITVTASSDTKGYDGTTNSSAAPTVTVGSIASGDTAAFTQSFDTKNVGINKTLTPTGSVSDTNGGANYAVTFLTNTTGVITARAITVTAATDTKGYDGNASSAGIPTVTSGSLAPGDTSGFTQVFADRNVGTSKTINASGIVNDGNSGNNYTVTLVANTTGVITARAITVTAATDTKTYDGSTSSVGVPTITTGSLVGGDTATFTQTFDTRNVGTGKILTPAGTVSDGNSGHNYAVTFATNTTGVINALAITVTAVSATKVYDGGTAAAGTPTISPALVGGDTSGFTQAFATKHVGTNKAINASGVVIDGNGGNNYTVTFVPNSTGEITKLAITVTATAATKTYDGGVTSAGIPTITSGSLVGGDTAVFSQTYDNRKAGTGKTLTPTGTITDGNTGGNYDVTYTPVTTGVINKLAITVTAVTSSKTYDGNTSSAGVPTVSPALINPDSGSFSQAYDTANAGTNKVLTPTGTITDGNNGDNYAVTYTPISTGAITPADATCSVTAYSVPFDGNPHTATGSCHGLTLGEDLSAGLDLTHTTHTDPGTYNADYWTFASPNGNYNSITDHQVITDVITSATLTGTVKNINASNQPVDGVTVTATGTPTLTGTTDPTGSYSITGFGGGSYSFSAAKTAQGCNIDNGITADDAALVSQYVVHLAIFNATQQAAAHVSSVTSTISSLDAALIAQKAVFNCHANNRSGQWIFNAGSLSPTVMNGNKVDDFMTYLMGDVDGSWTTGGANRPAEENTAASPNAVIGSVPETAGDPATQVTVPFRIDNLAGKTVRSTQFDIVYDPAVVDAVGASVQGTNADSLGVVSNVPTPGLLKVAVYGAVPVGGDGVYVNLTFTVKGGAGSSTPLTVRGFRFNANTDEVTSVSGRITVTGEAAAATFNGRLVSASGRTIGGGTITLRSTAGVVFTMGPTGKNGIFSFTGLKANETYTVSVTSARYTFAVRQVTTSQSLTSMDLIADQ